MKRILLEVFLVAALIGAGVFGFMNQKQAATSKAKITELTAAVEAAEKSVKEKEESLKGAEEEISESLNLEAKDRAIAPKGGATIGGIGIACDQRAKADACRLREYFVELGERSKVVEHRQVLRACVGRRAVNVEEDTVVLGVNVEFQQ